MYDGRTPLGFSSATARTAAGWGGRSSRLLPKILVTAQVMLSLVLLAGAGLFLRTLKNLQNQDFGFNRRNVLLVRFNAKFAGYNSEQLDGLYRQIDQTFAAIPGLHDAAYATYAPMSYNNWSTGIAIEGGDLNVPKSASYTSVSPRFFDAAGTRVLNRQLEITFDDVVTVRGRSC